MSKTVTVAPEDAVLCVTQTLEHGDDIVFGCPVSLVDLVVDKQSAGTSRATMEVKLKPPSQCVASAVWSWLSRILLGGEEVKFEVRWQDHGFIGFGFITMFDERIGSVDVQFTRLPVGEVRSFHPNARCATVNVAMAESPAIPDDPVDAFYAGLKEIPVSNGDQEDAENIAAAAARQWARGLFIPVPPKVEFTAKGDVPDVTPPMERYRWVDLRGLTEWSEEVPSGHTVQVSLDGINWIELHPSREYTWICSFRVTPSIRYLRTVDRR